MTRKHHIHDVSAALPKTIGRTALFPAADERLRIDDLLTKSLTDAQARVAVGPVNPAAGYDCWPSRLAEFDFSAPLALDQVLLWVIEQMEHGVVHVNHPRYFGLFNPTPTFPAQCADRVVAAFNPQLATKTTSPFPVELEAHVIRAVARRAGLPAHTGGHFATGGSEANYTALLCALTRADQGFAKLGARAFHGQPAVYVSREAHLAWLKIVHQVGIGRDALRLVETDGMGRMSEAALAANIRSDLANGHVPVMIAATAGTTSAGMVDPLAACAEIARRHELWYHIDAAWGGAAIASDRLRGSVAGIETADSVTIDAHKWLATTMGCAMLLVAQPGVLSAVFHAAMECMPSYDEAIDPYVTTMQWSRRFLGLRLFVSLAAAGWSGYAAHVERAVDLTGLLGEMLTARGWKRANNSPLAVLCMAPPNGRDARSIAQAVVGSGVAWVSALHFEGRQIIRACLTSGETTEADISALADQLTVAA